jgi:uncharacterized protein GlcG (DUF336 family)
MNTRLFCILISFVTLVTLSPILTADEQPTMVNIKRMSLDVAVVAAKAAIDACRKEAVQVAVTIVDRGGHPQVVLRDVLAMDVTLTLSKNKAYTAMSMNTSTQALMGTVKESYSWPKLDSLVVLGGGLPISASGNILGGIGVSGSPSSKTDDKCAQAGLDAIADDLEMASM